jgi:hypothetical protein
VAFIDPLVTMEMVRNPERVQAVAKDAELRLPRACKSLAP